MGWVKAQVEEAKIMCSFFAQAVLRLMVPKSQTTTTTGLMVLKTHRK